MAQKVVLAYSGGLDTSCILKWLLEQNYEVICYLADVGQEEDFEAANAKAMKIGATKMVIEDLKENFVTKYVWPAIQMGLIYETRYLLGTSLARPCIALGMIECAKKNGAKIISHGATGKGNDQVRFELSCYALWPTVKILAPWRVREFFTRFPGRQELLQYAQEKGIPVSATKSAPWSTDANIMHVSYEAGILESPANTPPKELYQMTSDPVTGALDIPTQVDIQFVHGLPYALKTVFGGTKVICNDPLQMLITLNKIASVHGVGRIDIVENRFIGLKSRGVYETPGTHVLHLAHTDLETICLDREVLRIQAMLRDRMADYVYNGFWFSPEAEYVRKCITEAQINVNGTVMLQLFKGNVLVLGRTCDVSLYNKNLVSMDKNDDFDPTDSTGFINIQALRLKEYHRYKIEFEELKKKNTEL